MKDKDKAEYRARVRAMIERFDTSYISRSDEGITEELLALPEYLRAERVFTYYSEERECSTLMIIEEALHAGKTVALPIVFSEGRMEFAKYNGELVAGAFGIPEPLCNSDIIRPDERDILVVPALCCDMEGYRLGRGGGYYDRYLVGCPSFTVCLCRQKLLDKKVPREWNDLPVTAVITENGVIRA